MTSKQQEIIDELPYDDPDTIIISKKDVEFLKGEYADMRSEQFLNRKRDENLSTLCHGIARGLEIALVRLGVTNDELDEISRKASRGCGG